MLNRHLVTTAILLSCTPLFAQPDNSADTLDTIIVSAARSPLERTQVGGAVTVITRNLIEIRQARYVTDVLRSVPGFSVSRTGAVGSQTQVRVRGAEANHVLVLIDGMRANDPASGDEFRWEYLTTGNVERIEIVRGPQSSLWGSDAVAAVVNVITHSGKGANSLGAYAEGGSNNARNVGVNGGTGGENWSLGFGIERLATDGTNISRSGMENDGSDVLTASISADLEASRRLSFGVGLRMVDAYAEIDPTDFAVTGLPTDGDVVNEGTRTYLQAGATLQGNVRQHLGVRYLDSSNNNLVSGVQDAATESDRLTLAYQADFSLRDNLLSLALEREETDFRQRGPVVFGDPNQDQEMSVASAIADYQHHASDNLTLLVSVRFDDNSDFDSVVTGRGSVAWQLSSDTRLRANIGTGQKSPTFTERFGFFPGQFVGNPNLKPESSTSYDIGLDREFSGDRVSLGLTLFHQDLENEINGFVFDPVTFLSTAENRSDDSNRTGVEIDARITLSEFIELSGNYTYTDSSESNAGTTTQELRRPRHAGHLSASYRIPQRRANLYLAADYGGTRSDIFFPPFPDPSQIVTLSNFWLVDFTASYDVTDSLDVFFRVKNLLDENYEEIHGFATPGRSAFMGVRATFGR